MRFKTIAIHAGDMPYATTGLISVSKKPGSRIASLNTPERSRR